MHRLILATLLLVMILAFTFTVIAAYGENDLGLVMLSGIKGGKVYYSVYVGRRVPLIYAELRFIGANKALGLAQDLILVATMYGRGLAYLRRVVNATSVILQLTYKVRGENGRVCSDSLLVEGSHIYFRLGRACERLMSSVSPGKILKLHLEYIYMSVYVKTNSGVKHLATLDFTVVAKKHGLPLIVSPNYKGFLVKGECSVGTQLIECSVVNTAGERLATVYFTAEPSIVEPSKLYANTEFHHKANIYGLNLSLVVEGYSDHVNITRRVVLSAGKPIAIHQLLCEGIGTSIVRIKAIKLIASTVLDNESIVVPLVGPVFACGELKPVIASVEIVEIRGFNYTWKIVFSRPVTTDPAAGYVEGGIYWWFERPNSRTILLHASLDSSVQGRSYVWARIVLSNGDVVEVKLPLKQVKLITKPVEYYVLTFKPTVFSGLAYYSLRLSELERKLSLLKTLVSEEEVFKILGEVDEINRAVRRGELPDHVIYLHMNKTIYRPEVLTIILRGVRVSDNIALRCRGTIHVLVSSNRYYYEELPVKRIPLVNGTYGVSLLNATSLGSITGVAIHVTGCKHVTVDSISLQWIGLPDPDGVSLEELLGVKRRSREQVGFEAIINLVLLALNILVLYYVYKSLENVIETSRFYLF